MKALVDTVNQVVPPPNARCVAENKDNLYLCMMAEHLVNYIDTPLFISQSLFDYVQLGYNLEIPCMYGGLTNLNNCTGKDDQLQEIYKFANYTRAQLQKVYDMSPKNRSIWSPACPMHCYYNYGEMDDPLAAKWAVPVGTENTLGETSHWFFYQNLTGAYID